MSALICLTLKEEAAPIRKTGPKTVESFQIGK